MDASRLDNGKLTLHRQPVAVALLARQMADELQPGATRAGIHLMVAADGDAGVVEADPARLRQVLGNLLSNAFKFTPRGGTVTIQVNPAPDGVTVRVADTGPGIPEDKLEAIFERFYQTDAVRDQAKGGLGLGLAISRGLVTMHGGHLSARSTPGRGATFTFTLPAVPQPVA